MALFELRRIKTERFEMKVEFEGEGWDVEAGNLRRFWDFQSLPPF
jgi:hypothetical protein